MPVVGRGTKAEAGEAGDLSTINDRPDASNTAGDAGIGNATNADAATSWQSEARTGTPSMRNTMRSTRSTMRSTGGKSKFGDNKKADKDDLTNSSNTKVWVKFRGPDGDEQKILLNRGCYQFELRKAVSAMTGVNPRELNLFINDRELKEARNKAFVRFDPKRDVIEWCRGDRLKAMLQLRNLAHLTHLDRFERSIVHFSVIDGDTELTQQIIDHVEFDMTLMNKQDIFGDTAMMLAAIQGFTDLVELLLDRQAGLEFQNIYGRTALMMASEHGHDGVVRSLLRAGATTEPNPGTKRPDALYLAKLNRRFKVMKAVTDHLIEVEEGKKMEAMFSGGDDALLSGGDDADKKKKASPKAKSKSEPGGTPTV